MGAIGVSRYPTDRFLTRPPGVTLQSFDPPWSTVSEMESIMAWKTPKIVEISVGMEINCYACAEL